MRFFSCHRPEKILVLFGSNSFLRPYSTATANAVKKPKVVRETALKKYGLDHLNLVWPECVNSSEDVDYIINNPKSISQMYGSSDLSKLPIFKGGFINFGYWPIPFFKNKEITIEQRINCSQEMYKVICDLAGISNEYNLLEVGCGLGYGSSFISKHYKPRLVIGLDISADQVGRAKKCQQLEVDNGKLRFTIGEAESMPFVDNSFDRIISIEAAQHFVSMKSFSEEVARVLKPGGQLVMTSFFPTSQEGINALNDIVPDYHIHGSQNTVKDVESALMKHMNNVAVTSIGEHVWYGFSKWLDQIGYHNQWSKIWCALYEKGLIDYVVYQASGQKLVNNPTMRLN